MPITFEDPNIASRRTDTEAERQAKKQRALERDEANYRAREAVARAEAAARTEEKRRRMAEAREAEMKKNKKGEEGGGSIKRVLSFLSGKSPSPCIMLLLFPLHRMLIETTYFQVPNSRKYTNGKSCSWHPEDGRKKTQWKKMQRIDHSKVAIMDEHSGVSSGFLYYFDGLWPSGLTCVDNCAQQHNPILHLWLRKPPRHEIFHKVLQVVLVMDYSLAVGNAVAVFEEITMAVSVRNEGSQVDRKMFHVHASAKEALHEGVTEGIKGKGGDVGNAVAVAESPVVVVWIKNSDYACRHGGSITGGICGGTNAHLVFCLLAPFERHPPACTRIALTASASRPSVKESAAMAESLGGVKFCGGMENAALGGCEKLDETPEQMRFGVIESHCQVNEGFSYWLGVRYLGIKTTPLTLPPASTKTYHPEITHRNTISPETAPSGLGCYTPTSRLNADEGHSLNRTRQHGIPSGLSPRPPLREYQLRPTPMTTSGDANNTTHFNPRFTGAGLYITGSAQGLDHIHRRRSRNTLGTYLSTYHLEIL
ncbi:hypothetical protein DFH27DRAFT_524326 [Peziza echinospora]|nr:hypothetical protein DFH27DRAFT_524326 [Peziza echinospora]